MTIEINKTSMRKVVRAMMRTIDALRHSGFSEDRVESLLLDNIWETLLTTQQIRANINQRSSETATNLRRR